MGVYVMECRLCGHMHKVNGTESMGCVETAEKCHKCDNKGWCYECDMPLDECQCEKEDA